jgi:hypothetical protein
MIAFLIDLIASFIGGMAALVVWFHFDIEGFWQQRRLEHGKKLDQRAEEAARKHGFKKGR